MKDNNTMRVNLTFGADDIRTALETAWNEGWLCVPCMEKITMQVQMSPSDFCEACQAAVMSLLMAAVESRIKQVLVRKGLSPDSLEIATD